MNPRPLLNPYQRGLKDDRWGPIKWTRIDGDYYADVAGIKFQIHHATVGPGAGFGLTARKDGRALHGQQTINWMGTKKRCVEWAEKILARETATP